MTEKEAKLILDVRISRFDHAEDVNEALEIAKQALEEVQQYRKIRAVEENYKTVQSDLPPMKNNDQRKEWLRNYRAWGLWYEDEHIGAKYYKYNFENGARLIAETYMVPETEFYIAHESCYFHLVGGPEPVKKNGVPKWERHEVYNRYPDSETELVEFLKEIQKKGR